MNLAEIRIKLQKVETILDGLSQMKDSNLLKRRRRINRALSLTRSLQAKYFPTFCYSLNRYRGNPKIINGKPESPLDRTNFKKYKKLKMLESHPKLNKFV